MLRIVLVGFCVLSALVAGVIVYNIRAGGGSALTMPIAVLIVVAIDMPALLMLRRLDQTDK